MVDMILLFEGGQASLKNTASLSMIPDLVELESALMVNAKKV